MPFAGIRAAQRHMLVKRHIVADLRRLADHGKAMIDEQMAADLRAGMNVDAGEEAGEMVDRTREKIEPRLEQRVRDTVPEHRPDARIQQNLHARTRRGITRLDRVQICNQPAGHGIIPCSKPAI
jgi:hypothetical protein